MERGHSGELFEDDVKYGLCVNACVECDCQNRIISPGWIGGSFFDFFYAVVVDEVIKIFVEPGDMVRGNFQLVDEFLEIYIRVRETPGFYNMGDDHVKVLLRLYIVTAL